MSGAYQGHSFVDQQQQLQELNFLGLGHWTENAAKDVGHVATHDVAPAFVDAGNGIVKAGPTIERVVKDATPIVVPIAVAMIAA